MFKSTLKPFLNVFSDSPPKRPPIWFMRQAGRYLPEYRQLRKENPDFIRFCLSPKMTSEAALQPLRRFPLDAAILFSDILILPFALGQKVTFKEKVGPCLGDFDWEKLSSSYNLSRILETLTPVFESLILLKSQLSPTTACLGLIGAPFTVAAYMIERNLTKDLKILKSTAYAAPFVFQEFLEALSLISAHYACHQVEAGAEALQIFDSWAGFIPEFMMESWFYRPLRIIVEILKEKYPHIPILGYGRGMGGYGQTILQKTGLDAFSFDQSFCLEKPFSFQGVFQGNLDSSLLIKPSEFLFQETERLLSYFKGKKYIFNVAQGLLPETDPLLLKRLMDFILTYPY